MVESPHHRRAQRLNKPDLRNLVDEFAEAVSESLALAKARGANLKIHVRIGDTDSYEYSLDRFIHGHLMWLVNRNRLILGRRALTQVEFDAILSEHASKVALGGSSKTYEICAWMAMGRNPSKPSDEL